MSRDSTTEANRDTSRRGMTDGEVPLPWDTKAGKVEPRPRGYLPTTPVVSRSLPEKSLPTAVLVASPGHAARCRR